MDFKSSLNQIVRALKLFCHYMSAHAHLTLYGQISFYLNSSSVLDVILLPPADIQVITPIKVLKRTCKSVPNHPYNSPTYPSRHFLDKLNFPHFEVILTMPDSLRPSPARPVTNPRHRRAMRSACLRAHGPTRNWSNGNRAP